MTKKEFGITVFTFAFAVLAFVLMPTQTVGTSMTHFGGINITPRIFPIFSAGLMGILSLIHLIQLCLQGAKRKKAGGSFFAADPEDSAVWQVALVCVIMILYVLIMPTIGFILDSIILCTALAIFMKSKWWQVLVSGIALPIILYFLFRLVYVTMPTGTLWYGLLG